MTDQANMIWRKSSRSSSGGQCVEIAQTPEVTGVRDSKDQGGPALTFQPGAFQRFLAGVKADEFDC